MAYNSEQQELARVLQERSAVDSHNELTQLLHKIETRLTNKAEHIKILKLNQKIINVKVLQCIGKPLQLQSHVIEKLKL